jgi:hypothetical protein
MTTKEHLKQLLKENTLLVKFQKINGEIREMKCTLKQDVVPPYQSKDSSKKKTENDNVIAAWDVNKKEFRSFRLDLLQEYHIFNELCNPCDTIGSGCSTPCSC